MTKEGKIPENSGLFLVEGFPKSLSDYGLVSGFIDEILMKSLTVGVDHDVPEHLLAEVMSDEVDIFSFNGLPKYRQ